MHYLCLEGEQVPFKINDMLKMKMPVTVKMFIPKMKKIIHLFAIMYVFL